jgi:hypothetical protein
MNTFLHRILAGSLAAVCLAGVVFAMTGRFAVRQVTRDNLAAVKTFTGEVGTNSLSARGPNIYELEVRLYKRVALSRVREHWEDACTLALTGAMIAGVLSIVIFFKGRSRLVRPSANMTGVKET